MRSLALFLLSGALYAQSQLATVNGTIVDSSAAVIPAPELKFTNLETGESWSTTTNNQGGYMLPLIKPGNYQMDVSKPGFKPYRRTEIVLDAGGQHRLDAQLELGTQNERVTVQADAPQLQTETSVVGAVVTNRTIADMPLINRRAAQLARLTGFVVQVGTGANFAMGGGRGNNTDWRFAALRREVAQPSTTSSLAGSWAAARAMASRTLTIAAATVASAVTPSSIAGSPAWSMSCPSARDAPSTSTTRS